MLKRRSYIHSSMFFLVPVMVKDYHWKVPFFSKKIVLGNGPSIQELDVFSRVKEIVRFDDQ